MGLLADILHLRAYAQTKDAIAAAQDSSDMPAGPMVERVFDVEYELLQRRSRELGG